MAITERVVSEAAYRLLWQAAVQIPADVKKALQRSFARETSPAARAQLETVRANIEVARRLNIPVCQDTGVPLFFLTVGSGATVKGDLRRAIEKATAKATRDIPLRENVIHPLTKQNSGTNTGWGMPHIYFDLAKSSGVEITALPKGFGSEAKTSVAYIATSEPIEEGVVKSVLDCVLDAGGDPCPPYIVGVGLGGTGDIAITLSKKAYLRTPLGSRHPDPRVARLEKKLLAAVNKTGIGAMGVGGAVTALAAHVEICGTHTAAVPVAVSFQCWAARRATARISNSGRVRYLTKF